jgi:hypothetical protein
MMEQLKKYLDSLVERKLVRSNYVDTMWKVWEKIQATFNNTLSEPDAGVSGDGYLMLAFDDGVNHLEFEMMEDDFVEVFFLNRNTDAVWGTDFLVNDPLSDMIIEKLRLFQK